jgi:FlaA1/EpsC-like NDP-sugar epimerase
VAEARDPSSRLPKAASLRSWRLVSYDIAAVSLAVVGAIALRFDTANLLATIQTFLPAALIPIAVQPLVNGVLGLYRREWRFASIRDLGWIVAAVATAGAISIVILAILADFDVAAADGLPRSFVPLVALLSVAVIGGGRLVIRIRFEAGTSEASGSGTAARVPGIVYGAGEAGATIARMAVRDPSLRLRVLGFLDDDPAKQGSSLLGKRVYGGIDALGATARATGASELVIAMPSAPGEIVRRAVDAGRELGLEVRIVPALNDLLGLADEALELRPVNVDDLLRRSPVHVDLEELAGYINGRCVLITGAGGSIGSELARQIGRFGPRRLVLLDNNETALWAVDHDLRAGSVVDASALSPVMADVRSARTMDRVIGDTRPDVVFHAAAMKHVPICEVEPGEAVLTNVIGTRNVLDACDAHGVSRFVLISTDKAVRPVSVMGATKRFAELLTLTAAIETGRSHMAVRFGNVLGSSGSVVPIFRRQLELGLPLTITHPSATRYFMTIPEAVSLILQAGATAAVGEIYILDMGEPVRIVDLANDMIRLSGIDPARVEIVYTGLRPGERLEERLFYDHESLAATTHERIWRVPRAEGRENDGLAALVGELERAGTDNDERGIRDILATAGILHIGLPTEIG